MLGSVDFPNHYHLGTIIDPHSHYLESVGCTNILCDINIPHFTIIDIPKLIVSTYFFMNVSNFVEE